jgi:hypothetical protein
MNRNLARRLTDSFKEPRSMGAIMRQIGLAARIGLGNTSVSFKETDREKAMRAQVVLLDKGFVAELRSARTDRLVSPGEVWLEVQW